MNIGRILTDFEISQLGAVSMIHSVPDLLVNIENARELGAEDLDRLIRERKLVLILDLDHTLVHSRNTTPEINESPNFYTDEDVQVYKIISGRAQLEVAVRPGAIEFLQSLSKIYEMHVFTLGTRNYADQVVKLIDPDNSLIRDRIRTRCESSSHISKEQEVMGIFPAGDQIVVILDDRRDVWAGINNIIQVLPFEYFCENSSPCYTKFFTHDTISHILKYCDKSDYLSRLSLRLHELHSLFFEIHTLIESSSLPNKYQVYLDVTNNVDLKCIISHLRSIVLSSCKIVFTGVLSLVGDPSSSPEYLLASFMGAEVRAHISSDVTHVITSGVTTEKVIQAAGCGFPIQIVTTDWLYCCYYLGEHVPEDEFLHEVTGSPPLIDSSDSEIAEVQDRKRKSLEDDPNDFKKIHSDIDFEVDESIEEFLKELEDGFENSDSTEKNMNIEKGYLFTKTDTDCQEALEDRTHSLSSEDETLLKFAKDLDSYFE